MMRLEAWAAKYIKLSHMRNEHLATSMTVFGDARLSRFKVPWVTLIMKLKFIM